MALTNIAILRYNNYYNRIKKRNDTLAEYLTQYSYVNNVNFYKRDGVDTTLTINSGNLLHGISGSVSIENADYLIEYDTDIISRWFVLEAMQQRNGQYVLTLKRDVFADHWDSVLDATSLIEKATVNSDDVAIYNMEGTEFNLVKSNETLLKDKTRCPWIVGYYAPNITDDQSFSSGGSSINAIRVDNIANWEYYAYRTADYKYVDDSDYESFDLGICVTGLSVLGYPGNQWMKVMMNGKTTKLNGDRYYPIGYKGSSVPLENWIHDNREAILSKFFQYSTLKRTDISEYNGRYLYETSTGKYYRITITNTGSVTETTDYALTDNVTSNINALIMESEYAYAPSYSSYGQNISSTATYKKLRVSLDEENIGLNLASQISSTSNLLADAPYKMFAIPYGIISVRVSTASQGYIYTIGHAEVNALVNAMITKLGSNLYDVQLLPYCPMRDRMEDGDGWVMNASDTAREHKDFDYIMSGTDKKGVIFYPKVSTFTFDIESSLELPNDSVGVKVENQCTRYRLCSPNQSAIFEFNLARSGSISRFNVDCTYKPFSPYIHVNPVWGKLYGRDYDDTRGLIVQGDFSIPVIKDQWVEYQINNKNYLNSFNRQVESIELANSFARVNENIGSLTKVGQGAMSGSAYGAYGAAAGTMVSAMGGAYDIYANESMRRNQLDAMRDQFNYSLRNIQALPNTLAKVSSYDANNKMFIVLEKYTCTDQEREIFRNMLRYEGMTVMRVGTLRDFVLNEQSYIRARIIRIDLAGDTHMANAIAEELARGVYI